MEVDLIAEKLHSLVSSSSFVSNESLWVNELDTVLASLKDSHSKKDSERFVLALSSLYDVIDQQTPRMNYRLIVSVNILNLPELISVLQQIFENTKKLQSSLATAKRVNHDAFGKGLSALTEHTKKLSELCSEHDALQLFDDLLRVELTQANNDSRNFYQRWPNLYKKLTYKTRGLDEGLVKQLNNLSSKMDKEFNVNPAGLSDVLMDYRSLVSQHFVKVDFDLKVLCAEICENTNTMLDLALAKTRPT